MAGRIGWTGDPVVPSRVGIQACGNGGQIEAVFLLALVLQGCEPGSAGVLHGA